MPGQVVEKNFEQAGRLTPEATLQLSSEAREAERLARFDAWIEALSKRGSAELGKVEDPAPFLAPILEAFGRLMQADRLVFYGGLDPAAGEGDDLRPVVLWRSSDDCVDGLDQEPALALDSLGEGRRDLLAGFAHRRAGRFRPASNPTSEAHRGAWAPVRTNLFIPCLANGDLLGVFRFEASLAASRWGAPIVRRAEFATRLVANLLDRLRLAREVEELRKRDSRADRLSELGRVASGVAHDFNNVLTAILGYADLLELELSEKNTAAENEPFTGQVELAEIRDAATRATGLVDHVLSFGRAPEERTKRVDLSETLRRLEGTLRRVVGSGVAVDVRPGLVDEAGEESSRSSRLVALDPERFERVLLNLAANARDAIPGNRERPRFEVSLHRVQIDRDGVDPSGSEAIRRQIPGLAPGPYLRLTARDNGCGIDPAQLERIFEPFFTTKGGGGTGLGLALGHEFMRDVGGGICVESAPGQGSAFHLYFPVVDAVPAPVTDRASGEPRSIVAEPQPSAPHPEAPGL